MMASQTKLTKTLTPGLYGNGGGVIHSGKLLYLIVVVAIMLPQTFSDKVSGTQLLSPSGRIK